MKELELNAKGNLVSLLQLTLKDLKLYSGNIDGIFGNNTLTAVEEFQREENISVDGIVGKNTWNKLYKYISVPTTLPYDSDILNINISSFILKFPFIRIGSIGNTVMGKDIPYIRLGVGTKQLLYVASTHANEWITTTVLMKFVEDYATSYTNSSNINGIPVRELYNSFSIYIIPMLNIDGVDLVTNNISKSSNYFLTAKQISLNYPNIPFPDGWKANINGIDLNLQFPALWENAKEIKFAQGFTTPAPRDFVGNYPLQAPEAVALYDFTINNDFKLMLTYHSQGEVIFWKFQDFNPPNSQAIGEELSRLSGYSLETTPYNSSFAGFKDWFIQNYNLPGYTVEVGLGTNPLPLSQFDKIYNDNLPILITVPTLI